MLSLRAASVEIIAANTFQRGIPVLAADVQQPTTQALGTQANIKTNCSPRREPQIFAPSASPVAAPLILGVSFPD